MQNSQPIFKRVRFFSEATFIVNGQSYSVQIIDLSLKGALIEVPNNCQYELDDPNCRLTFNLADSLQTLSMQVTIVRETGQNFLGVAINNIDIDSITHLKNIVQLNAGDPKLLERELHDLIHQNSSSSASRK